MSWQSKGLVLEVWAWTVSGVTMRKVEEAEEDVLMGEWEGGGFLVVVEEDFLVMREESPRTLWIVMGVALEEVGSGSCLMEMGGEEGLAEGEERCLEEGENEERSSITKKGEEVVGGWGEW